MARRTNATITQVAREAGVSPATVSRVMNGRFLGEPTVAERVRQVARDLDYSPSPIARGLALGQTRTVGFLVPDLANPTFQSMLSSLGRDAARDGYRVLVADSEERPEEEASLAVEIRRRCDSIVLCAPRMPEDQLAALAESLAPLVVINRPSTRVAAPSLSIDYRTGVHLLGRHLCSLGHRRLLYLEGPPSSVSNASRLQGIADLEESVEGLTVLRRPCGATLDAGHGAVDAVRESGATAVLAFNDLVAMGLVNGLAEAGVSVPGDVSVTGFDDIPLARYVAPPLTTASVPHDELGRQAWVRLRALVRGDVPEHNLVFQPRLEVRGSTVPPAG